MRRYGTLTAALLVGCLILPPVSATAAYDSVVVVEARIPTRYGEDLRAHLAFPGIGGVRATGPFPVVLTYSPYCDDGFNFIALAGFVSAWVNLPGTCGSDGRTPVFSERVGWAGYDAVEWLAGFGLDGLPRAGADWTTGRVGTLGGSADGISQLFVAQHHPPHLEAIAPLDAMGDFYGESLYRGGMLNVTDSTVFQAIIYGLWYEPGIHERLTDDERRRRMLANGWLVPETRNLEFYAHPLKDDFWDEWTIDYGQIDVPIMSLGNWDDFFTLGNVRMFERGGTTENMLVMGQAGHAWPDPGFDHQPAVIEWFDRWLRDGAATATPRVRYYVQQEHAWHGTSDWPPPEAENIVLHPASGASVLGATGPLSSVPGRGMDAYPYVPGQGRHNGQDGYVPHDALKPNRPSNDTVLGYNDPAHGGDQRLEAGSITYVTEPVQGPLEASGTVEAVLRAATTSTDTDWVVKLVDVFPDTPSTSGPQPGYWNLVTTGWLKGTHRNSHAREEPIPAGAVLDYRIEMMPTSYLFRAGHRIGIQIASSDASRSAVNPNPAVNTVFHTTAFTLPIIQR